MIHHTPQLNFGYFDYVCWKQETMIILYAICIETSLLGAFTHAVHAVIEL